MAFRARRADRFCSRERRVMAASLGVDRSGLGSRVAPAGVMLSVAAWPAFLWRPKRAPSPVRVHIAGLETRKAGCGRRLAEVCGLGSRSGAGRSALPVVVQVRAWSSVVQVRVRWSVVRFVGRRAMSREGNGNSAGQMRAGRRNRRTAGGHFPRRLAKRRAEFVSGIIAGQKRRYWTLLTRNLWPTPGAAGSIS